MSRAFAANQTFNSSQSEATIQSLVSGMSAGNVGAFTAGTYQWPTQLNVPCGVTLTGPVQGTTWTRYTPDSSSPSGWEPTQPTAIFNATLPYLNSSGQTVGYAAFSLSGCSTSSTNTQFLWLWVQNTGFLAVAGNTNNIVFQHNWDTNIYPTLPSVANASPAGYYTGIYICCSISDEAANIIIQYNRFGDANSCGGIYAQTYANGNNPDRGGACSALHMSTGRATNIIFNNNFVYHMEEHAQYSQRGTAGTGNPISVCVNCQIEYNWDYQWRRINYEDQTSTSNTAGTLGISVSHNSICCNPSPLGSTMGISMACCTSNENYTAAGNSPGDYVQDNLIFNTSAGIIPQAVEAWGTGAKWDYNVIQGYWGNYINVGYGAFNGNYGNPIWEATGNTLSGFDTAASYTPNPFGQEECNTTTTPTTAPTNLTWHGPCVVNGSHPAYTFTAAAATYSKTDSQQTTLTPTISQSASAVTITPVVQIAGQPISIFYTVDGTNPTVNSTLYSGPFTPAKNATVKAIAMWGIPPMPYSYPAPYGYKPSSQVSLVYTGTGGSPTLSSIAITGSSNSMTTGTTQQLTATCSYSSGAPQNCSSTVTWLSSATAVATVNSTGLVSAVAAGTDNITASMSSITSPAYALTVTAPSGSVNCSLASPTLAGAQTAVNAAAVGNCANAPTSFGTPVVNTVYITGTVNSVGGSLTFPCVANRQPIYLFGPAYADPTNLDGQTLGVVFNGPGGSGNTGFGFEIAGCDQMGSTISYIEWNGNRPGTLSPQPSGSCSTASQGGGGGIHIATGASNIKILYNYLHGNQANCNSLETYSDMIYADGNNTSTSYQTTSNVEIGWNQIGAKTGNGTSDCSNLQHASTWNGVYLDKAAAAGTCIGIGFNGQMANFRSHNNRIWNQLQAIKQYAPGNYPAMTLATGMSTLADDMQWCNRNCIEMQGRGQGGATPAGGILIQYDALSNISNSSLAGLMFSIPTCCGGTGVSGLTVTDALDNLLIADMGQAMGFEWSSNGTAAYNLFQGTWGNAVQWGYTNAPTGGSVNYNRMETSASSPTYVACESGFNSSCSPVPSQTGNVPGNSGPAIAPTQKTSAAPTISPASGAQSFPLTVTITDAGLGTNNTTAIPRGNTSFYCTTDGSTPTTASPWIGTGTGTLTLTGPATVGCVGMWGARNERKSYTAPYGFVPSSVVTATYSSGGTTPTLSSVSISSTGSPALLVGQTLQLSAVCTYSDRSQQNCTSSVSSWTSSVITVASVSSTGLVTAASAGSTPITATVNSLASSPYTVTVSTPSIAISGVTLATAGGATSIVVGNTNQLIATCSYTDGTSYNCDQVDAKGTDANFVSSNTSAATVSSAGSVTGQAAGSTNLTASAQLPAASSLQGVQTEDTVGTTSPGFINATYLILGNQLGGYTGTSCTFYLPQQSLTIGAKYDCGLIAAPTPSTMASTWTCLGTYTINAQNVNSGGFINVPMTGCGTMADGSAWWMAVNTNQSGTSSVGFTSCGGSACTGAAPTTAGTGSYPCAFVQNAYGLYSGLKTTLTTGGCGAGQVQSAQYVTLGQPTIISNTVPLTVTAAPLQPTAVTISIAGSPTTINVGSTLQFVATCTYSNGTSGDCTSSVSSWTSDNASAVTVSATGLATGIAAGVANIAASVNGVPSPGTYQLTAQTVPVTLTSITLNTTGGVNGLFIGQNNQLIASCLYSDHSVQNCTTTATGWTSSSPSVATVSTSGLIHAVAAGTTNFTASLAGSTSPPRPLTVLATPTGVYTITITGPVKFTGKVKF